MTELPCCYVAEAGLIGLHALDCPNHDPASCMSCVVAEGLRVSYHTSLLKGPTGGAEK